MAVGVETGSLMRPSITVVVQAVAPPVRHFAKPPGVMCNMPYCCGMPRDLLLKLSTMPINEITR